MNQTPTTETKPETGAPTWTQVIEEANEPPPQTYNERISCTLTPQDRLETGLKYTDAIKKRERFSDQTKQIVADRKARLASLDAEVKELEETFSTGRREVDVEVTEYTSLRLGKRWKVRRDTGEHFDERALTAEEREQYTPRKDAKQLSLADAAKKTDSPTNGSTEAASGDEETDEQPDSEGTSITDPEALLDDAADEGDEEDGE